MAKREKDLVPEKDYPAKVAKSAESCVSSFEKGTTEATWKAPEDGEEYSIRFIHAETCCESPYADDEDWPVISYVRPASDDENEYRYELSIIAGLWRKKDGLFVAFWGADEGDGHVDFYVRDDFEDSGFLSGVSGELCTKICPELIDAFDDGSGSERDPNIVPASVFEHDILSSLYASQIIE